MFYTKYRPQTFKEVSRPNIAADSLLTQLATAKTAHAYLFIGPRGTGKTTIARLLAKGFNCEKPSKDGDVCGKCSNCTEIQKGSFLDLIEIDAASNRGIDDIRHLREKVGFSPSRGKKKVYIIDEVHMLTNEAFNALLKTLEEPPAHAVFILCTTESHKIPDTIRSRCQVYRFKRATIAQIVTKLRGMCNAEGIDSISDEDLKKIAEASLGGFRDAETMLQQVAEGAIDVASFAGGASHQVLVAFVKSIMTKDAKSALTIVAGLESDGIDLQIWSHDVLLFLRDLMLVEVGGDSEMLSNDFEVLKELDDTLKSVNTGFVIFVLETFMKAAEEMSGASLVSLPLEIAIVKICDAGESKEKNRGSVLPVNPTVSEEIANTASEVVADDKRAFEEDLPHEDAFEEAKMAQTVVEDSTSYTQAAEVSFEEVREAWPKAVARVLEKNSSVHALVKKASPLVVEDGYLNVEVLYSFHKERLESPKNRDLVEGCLSEEVGVPIRIKCIVNKDKRPKKSNAKESGELTDYNVGAPVMSKNIHEIFDGALPL